MALPLLLLFALLGLLYICKKHQNYFRSVRLALGLPGPPALPILGNVTIIKNTEALQEIATNISKLYAPMLRSWMFFVPIILVYEPEHLKVVLGSTKTSDKNFFYSIMHGFLGEGLITSKGAKWKKNRRLIQPSFQLSPIESQFERFLRASQEMLEGLPGRQEDVQISRAVNTCVLSILHQAVLGVALQSEAQTPFRRGEVLVLKRVLRPWLLLDWIFRRSEMSRGEARHSKDLRRYVKEIMEARKSSNPQNPCLLDRFIELWQAGDFSEDDVLNETVTFMLAGQDSVGATVAFCLYYLAKHQDVQERVFREVHQITLEQVNQMHYLEQCLKETLRLVPSIPLVSRCLSCDVTLGRHTIPSGTHVFISPFATHRLPHIHPDPLRFDPDRFSQDNLSKMHPYGFIPFSAGPRNCIGYKFALLEMKTIIASVIKKYHLGVTQGRQELPLVFRVTLRAKGGIWLRLTPREGEAVN